MSTVIYPNQYRNYCVFDENKINKVVMSGENSLSKIEYSLIHNTDEDNVVENLYILNRMLDNGVDKSKIAKLYPALSKYNDTKSPNIQTYLAGIYRKTKVPDGFGPLVKMLIQDSINPPSNTNFDPTEEIGGAILDYLA